MTQTDGRLRALAAGAAGAITVTLVHQATRALTEDAPRMDVLGMRALAKSMHAVGLEEPPEQRLYAMTLGGDLAGNAAYYSLVGTGSDANTWKRGVLLGLAAGVGSVLLPPRMGLGSAPSRRTTKTKVMSVALYTMGGLAAAGAARLASRLSASGSGSSS